MRRTIYAVLITVLGLAAIGLSASFQSSQTTGQAGDIVSELSARLVQQGVPVKSIEFMAPSSRLEVTLQSTSDGGVVAPQDPSFEHAVQREVAVMNSRSNTAFDTVKITIVNTKGFPIYWSDMSVWPVESEPAPPSRLDDAAVAEWVRAQIPLYGMSLDELRVSSNADGDRAVTFSLSVQDIETANTRPGFLDFMGMAQRVMEKQFDVGGPQIALYRVDLTDAAGQSLLRYVYDLQLSSQRWWKADGLTCRWFPHPPTSRCPD